MNSFISEHTAEYFLVPQLTRILLEKYQAVIPIKFSASREGSFVSIESFEGKSIKVLAFYPRRPKIKRPNEGIIQIKFNQLIFERTQFLIDKGIPVIAGSLLIDSFEKLQWQPPCCWFKIYPSGVEHLIEIKLNTEINGLDYIKPITDEEVQDIMGREASFLIWSDVINVLKEFKKQARKSMNFGFWGDNYKPVFFLCFQVLVPSLSGLS